METPETPKQDDLVEIIVITTTIRDQILKSLSKLPYQEVAMSIHQLINQPIQKARAEKQPTKPTE
jgi:hypothetical protein